GLRARVDQPDLLNGSARDDLGRQLHLAFGGRAEARATGRRGLDRRHHLGVRVTQDQRAPRTDEIDVAATVGVEEPRAAAPHYEAGRATDRAERAHRGIDPARDEAAGAVEEVLG